MKTSGTMFLTWLGCLATTIALYAADEPKKAKKPDIDDIFTKLDVDKDGKISSEEFKKLAGVNPPQKPEKAKKLDETKFKTLDTNKDSFLSKDELTKIAKARTKLTKVDVDASFTKLDQDKNGNLTAEEFKKFSEIMPLKKPEKAAQINEKMFKHLDANGDGSVNKDEFKKIAEVKKPEKTSNSSK